MGPTRLLAAGCCWLGRAVVRCCVLPRPESMSPAFLRPASIHPSTHPPISLLHAVLCQPSSETDRRSWCELAELASRSTAFAPSHKFLPLARFVAARNGCSSPQPVARVGCSQHSQHRPLARARYSPTPCPGRSPVGWPIELGTLILSLQARIRTSSELGSSHPSPPSHPASLISSQLDDTQPSSARSFLVHPRAFASHTPFLVLPVQPPRPVEGVLSHWRAGWPQPVANCQLTTLSAGKRQPPSVHVHVHGA